MSTDDTKHFDARNAKSPANVQSFFDKLSAGDTFTYSPAVGPDEIAEKADEVGEQVEYDGGMKMDYLGPKVTREGMARPENHTPEDAFYRPRQDHFDVYCPSCERLLDPIPEAHKSYFRQCPNDSCGRYFRIRIDDEDGGNNSATLIPARRYDRRDSGAYVSEDGAKIYKSPNRSGAAKWVGEHPELDGQVIEDTLREARAALDRRV